MLIVSILGLKINCVVSLFGIFWHFAFWMSLWSCNYCLWTHSQHLHPFSLSTVVAVYLCQRCHSFSLILGKMCCYSQCCWWERGGERVTDSTHDASNTSLPLNNSGPSTFFISCISLVPDLTWACVGELLKLMSQLFLRTAPSSLFPALTRCGYLIIL